MISNVYFRKLIVHRGQQQSSSKRLNTLCQIQWQATGQNEKFLDSGFIPSYIFFVPPLRVNYFTSFLPHAVVFRKEVSFFIFLVTIIMIMIKFVSLYMIARVVGQHLKPRWTAEAQLKTSRIELWWGSGNGLSWTVTNITDRFFPRHNL